MRVCFPIEAPEGLQSRINGHFGSAPAYVIVETETLQVEEIAPLDERSIHGICRFLRVLGKRGIDGLVVRVIGCGTLKKLLARNIPVYHAIEGPVSMNLDMVLKGNLPRLSVDCIRSN